MYNKIANMSYSGFLLRHTSIDCFPYYGMGRPHRTQHLSSKNNELKWRFHLEKTLMGVKYTNKTLFASNVY